MTAEIDPNLILAAEEMRRKLATEEQRRNLLLDASLLLAPRNLRQFLGSMELPDGETVFVPQSLMNAFSDGRLDPNAVRPFIPESAYRRTQAGEGWGYLSEFLAQPGVIPYGLSAGDMASVREGGALEIIDALYGQHPGLVGDILVEEWVFLQTHSWITSRTKWTFTQFVRAGGIAIEAGRKGFDDVLAKAGDELPRLITRKGAKRGFLWVATTGTPILVRQAIPAGDLIDALLGGAISIAAGGVTNRAVKKVFVLIDP